MMRELSERKKIILRAIVDAYIESGEPVGSKFLMGQSNISCSSATIRNEMAELEDMGYLEQPHTSAGRIPSERGYRFYVDSLMQTYNHNAEELRELNTLVRNKVSELDNILERAASVMTSLTNYTALTVKHRRNASSIIRFKTIRLGSDLFLLIMVTATEAVITKYIHVDEGVDDDSLAVLEASLNELMRGIDPETITLPIMMKLQTRMYGCEYLIPPVMRAIYEAYSESDNGDISFEGVNRLLQYPELRDIEKLNGLLGLFDHKSDIIDVVSKSDSKAVNVYIGNENNVDIMKHATFVFRTINAGDRVIGAIGVIGPCRMDYSKVVATVDYLSENISKMLSHNDDEDNK
ncbi:MAG: heat-inducible transcription repressor HrcA [Clostridia bacterium]|nr:heat-inducible transcription repressor HrcA [Clostridia bacterium]